MKTLLAATLIFAALQCWRPCFFLTDDNLDGELPFFIEVGRNLLAGHSPFVSQHIFGGDYNYLRDPAAFKWHPVYLLVSLLAGTPFRYLIVDVDAFLLLMLACSGFVVLALHVRRALGLAITDGWIMFYALSYTYTMIALTTGASWLMFLGNYSALPWLVLGILQPTWLRGIGLVALFVVHQTLGGHLAPTVSNSIFLSLFALGMSIAGRSPRPLMNWLAGYAIALVVVSPLLVPMLEGFASSMRSGGVKLEDMQANNIPFYAFPMSVFVGMALWLGYTNPFGHPYVTYTFALGASAAVWCLIPALWTDVMLRLKLAANRVYAVFDREGAAQSHAIIERIPRQKWNGIEVVTLAMMIFGAVMICRPIWVSEIMMQLPLVKALRWPFREFVQFQFFLHFFLVVRPPGLSVMIRKFSAWYGTLIFTVPLVLYSLPPTFNSMVWDRELILTGGMDQYWAQVRPLLKPGDRIAVIIPPQIYNDDRFEEPYSLLGTYNYAILADVVNAWGYSPTVPRDQTRTKLAAYYPYGAYHPSQRDALLAEQPNVKIITLESLRPLKITLTSKDGPAVDLTPFVPKRISKDMGPPPADDAK